MVCAFYRCRLLRCFFLWLALCAASLPSAAQTSPPPAPAPPALSYVVQPVFDGSHLVLDIELSYAGNAEGRDTLSLPSRFAALDDLVHAVQGLAALSPNTHIDPAGADTHTITYPPGQTVRVHYQVRQEQSGLLDSPDAYYRPLLGRTYFHFLGAAVWVYPGGEDAPRTVSLLWKNWPANWTLATSFGNGTAPPPFVATPYAFQEAVFVGGDFRLLPLTVRGRPVTVALRGRWPFHDDRFARLAAQLLEQDRAFWHDDDFPAYLITLLPMQTASDEAADSGGLELTHSVALFQPNRDISDAALTFVLAHELFHTWNADKIPAPGPSSAWLSEGFTDYYTRLLLLRGGLLSLDAYVKAWNKTLADYELSPASHLPQSKVTQLFFADPDVCRAPYRQGALLAANWNAALRRATQNAASLDDVMRDLLAACHPANGSAPAPAAALLPALLQKRGGPDVVPELARVVHDGGLLVPDPHALGPGYALQMRPVPSYELGFDPSAFLQKKTIMHLKSGCAAAQAGLREGMDVLGYDHIVFGDTTQPVVLSVQDIMGAREVSFYPQGQSAMVPQYVPVKGADPAATRAWFGLPR